MQLEENLHFVTLVISVGPIISFYNTYAQNVRQIPQRRVLILFSEREMEGLFVTGGAQFGIGHHKNNEVIQSVCNKLHLPPPLGK